MQRPPPFSNNLSCPVIIATCLSAVIVTVWWHTGGNVDKLTIEYAAFHSQPWRLVTWVLPHVNFFHLIFNLYWTMVFGVKIESVFGSAHTFAILLFLAAGSGVAEYALAIGGVGLSGVVYGLFGLLWVLSRHDSRFRGAVDQQTVVLLVGWFFLCIVLTYTGAMAVANVTHGAGAGLGMLLGWTIAEKKTAASDRFRCIAHDRVCRNHGCRFGGASICEFYRRGGARRLISRLFLCARCVARRPGRGLHPCRGFISTSACDRRYTGRLVV